MYRYLRPLLFALDAERAHGLTLGMLRLADRVGLARRIGRDTPTLPRRQFGLEFPNPVGLAAGLDKNGTCIDALAGLGFGFIEIGTTTPRPQTGNPRPRMFRLASHEAIINRLGFNNGGVEALSRNAENARFDGILGINIGKNFDTPNERAIDDYRFCLQRVYARASYVTLNLSSPNTKGLRELQHGDALRSLLSELRECQEKLAAQHGRRVPMLIKIAPDVSEAELDAMTLAFLDTGVDGVICTNTTVDHTAVADATHADEQGGLSGRPLFQRATEVLAGLHTRAGDAIPLIGVGGILDGSDAADKIRAGASLVQVYSGLVYRGPELIGECVREIERQHGDHYDE